MSVLRGGLYRILDDDKTRHSEGRWCDEFLITLIIVNSIAVTLETVPSFAARHTDALWTLEVFSVAVFSIEYALRVWVARDHPGHVHETPPRARLAYLRSPFAVIDLAAIPPISCRRILRSTSGYSGCRGFSEFSS